MARDDETCDLVPVTTMGPADMLLYAETFQHTIAADRKVRRAFVSAWQVARSRPTTGSSVSQSEPFLNV
jgi:hypothetical protein